MTGHKKHSKNNHHHKRKPKRLHGHGQEKDNGNGSEHSPESVDLEHDLEHEHEHEEEKQSEIITGITGMMENVKGATAGLVESASSKLSLDRVKNTGSNAMDVTKKAVSSISLDTIQDAGSHALEVSKKTLSSAAPIVESIQDATTGAASMLKVKVAGLLTHQDTGIELNEGSNSKALVKRPDEHVILAQSNTVKDVIPTPTPLVIEPISDEIQGKLNHHHTHTTKRVFAQETIRTFIATEEISEGDGNSSNNNDNNNVENEEQVEELKKTIDTLDQEVVDKTIELVNVRESLETMQRENEIQETRLAQLESKLVKLLSGSVENDTKILPRSSSTTTTAASIISSSSSSTSTNLNARLKALELAVLEAEARSEKMKQEKQKLEASVYDVDAHISRLEESEWIDIVLNGNADASRDVGCQVTPQIPLRTSSLQHFTCLKKPISEQRRASPLLMMRKRRTSPLDDDLFVL